MLLQRPVAVSPQPQRDSGIALYMDTGILTSRPTACEREIGAWRTVVNMKFPRRRRQHRQSIIGPSRIGTFVLSTTESSRSSDASAFAQIFEMSMKNSFIFTIRLFANPVYRLSAEAGISRPRTQRHSHKHKRDEHRLHVRSDRRQRRRRRWCVLRMGLRRRRGRRHIRHGWHWRDAAAA